jgi:hypothetical protein
MNPCRIRIEVFQGISERFIVAGNSLIYVKICACSNIQLLNMKLQVLYGVRPEIKKPDKIW